MEQQAAEEDNRPENYSGMQSPSSASAITTGICLLQHLGWADLPEDLLHSIVPLLGSVLALFAFASTCCSWRTALSSYPSKSRLCTFLPPLLIQPHISVQAPHLPSSTHGDELRTCKVVDLVNLRRTLCCQLPKVTFDELRFAGSSYGQMICGDGKNCLVVDMFTGERVSPPQLPFGDGTTFIYGMLTTPIKSQNSHLLVCAHLQEVFEDEAFLLDWSTGSNDWSISDLGDMWILQIVEFEGHLIAVGSGHKLYNLSLGPQLGLLEIAIEWWDNMILPFSLLRLVVCNGDLLIIEDSLIINSEFGVHKVYRLDMSTEPATCVEVVNLKNDALFIGLDSRSPPFSCKNPGRWGGRSNCLYLAQCSQPWVFSGLGDVIFVDQDIFNGNIRLRPFWVYPSMLYSDGQ